MLRVSKVHEDAKIPTRKHPTDAGLDLYSLYNIDIPPHSYAIARTGIKINLSVGYVGLIWPKGGSEHLVGAGVVDEGYQGEILVKVFNVSKSILKIKAGDAIAQFLLQPCYTPQVLEVDEENLFDVKTERGSTGGIVAQSSDILEILYSDEKNTVTHSGYKSDEEILRRFVPKDFDPLIGYNGEMED